MVVRARAVLIQATLRSSSPFSLGQIWFGVDQRLGHLFPVTSRAGAEAKTHIANQEFLRAARVAKASG